MQSCLDLAAYSELWRTFRNLIEMYMMLNPAENILVCIKHVTQYHYTSQNEILKKNLSSVKGWCRFCCSSLPINAVIVAGSTKPCFDPLLLFVIELCCE